MTSNYSLRSHKSLKRDSPPGKFIKSAELSNAAKSPVISNFLSPTLFKKFNNLVTRTPKKMSISPSKTSSMPRKRGGILSKRLIKTDATVTANPGNQGLVADFSLAVPKTPTNVSFSLTVPQTAPSKLENFKKSFGAVEPCEKVPEFTVWEDPELEDGTACSLASKSNSDKAPENDCNDQNREDDAEHEQVDEAKENKLPMGGLEGTFGISAGASAADNHNRQILSDVKVGGMQEYQDLIGKAFKIACSPKSMFYRGRPVACSAMPAAATATSPSVFKFPFPGIPYSKDLPPPSKLTRTHGSEHFRVTSVNLFKKSASASTSSMKPADSLYMDSLSPSTPHKLPEHIHGSRLHKRRVFPQVKLFALDGAPELAESIELNSKLSQEMPSLVASFSDPDAAASSIIDAEQRVGKDSLQLPSPPPSYNLRPRRGQAHPPASETSLPNPNANNGLPPLGNNSLNVVGSRKKLRKPAPA